MFEYLKKRYADENVRVRALAHGMCDGLVVAWLVTHFGVFGFLGLLTGLGIEIKQAIRAIPGGYFDLKDAACDLCEHLLGGIILGGFFYLTRGL